MTYKLMNNLTDPRMDFIARHVCTEIVYESFASGFNDQNETETRTERQTEEIEGWNLELFKHERTEDWVIWFWDDEGDERYFGEFWLAFDRDKREVAERAFKLLADFLRDCSEAAGSVPPYLLDDKLYEIVNSIWGKDSGKKLPAGLSAPTVATRD